MSSSSTLRLVALSDTHQLHRELDMPQGDIMLFAGDLSMFSRSVSAIRDFGRWLSDLPYRHKVLTYGNHEFLFEGEPGTRSMLGDAIVLVNQSVEVAGLKIWGSPVTNHSGGAFGLSSPADRCRLYDTIPDDTDIVITHLPPYGILDCRPESDHHGGCPELLSAVKRIKPRLHVFGHIHGGFGITQDADTTYVNAALLGPDGELEHKPVVLEMSAV